MKPGALEIHPARLAALAHRAPLMAARPRSADPTRNVSLKTALVNATVRSTSLTENQKPVVQPSLEVSTWYSKIGFSTAAVVLVCMPKCKVFRTASMDNN